MQGSFSNKKVVCIVLFSIFMLVLLWGGITIHNTNSTITEISTVKNLDDLVKNTEVNSVSEAFNSKQLIIMSNNSNFKSYGAERIQNYDNMYIAYYKTKLGAKYAYSMLKNSKDIAYISINNILEVSEEGEELEKERDTQVEETELGKYIKSLRVRKGVRVAILDTGLNIENFKGKYEDIKADYTNETENSLSDTNGHGTKMAELIYENSNDSVNILPIKIANSEGKTSVLNVYLGIKKAIEAKADIVNLSMTASKSSTSEIITEAINEATEQGILVVVSAGNNKKDVDNITPANIESAIVISAVGSNKEFANYSNYGSTVDFSAVGTYKGEVGTSFATARVSGILANALTKGTDLETIAAYAEDLGEEGKDRYYGKGLLALSIENGGEDYVEGSNDSSTSIKEESTVTPDQPNEQVHDHEHEHVNEHANEQELKELINSQNPDASLFESQVIPEDIVVFTTNEDFDVTKDFYNISYNSNNFKLEYIESVPSFKLEDGYYRVTYKATELTSGYYFNFYRYISVKSPQEGIEYDLSEFKEDVLTIASGVVDVTNATTGGIIGHTCVGTHMSDATQHWQECNICGEEISGTRGTHVYVGDKPSALPDPTRGECAPTNNYTQICSCGRSISVPRKEHINIVTNRISNTQFYHYAACDCNSWVAWYNNGTSSIQMCTHNGVIINCFTAAGTARTCDTCGNTHENKGHSLQLNELGGNTDSSYAGSGGITCAYCNNVVLNVKCSGAKYSNNYSNVTLEYLITPVRGTLSAGSGWLNGHDENIHSLSTTISASGSGYLLKIAGTISDSAHGNIRGYQWAQNIVNTVNGTSTNCTVYTHNYFLYKDHNEPQISSCTAVSKNITDGWGKGVDITITGTEDTTERVKAKLYNASGTLIQEKEVAVSNKSYTVNFSPAYESKDGETWQVDIVDLYGNTVNAYFNMPKCVDATLPVSGGYSIDNTTWTKTKTLTITAYDYGAGDLQFNLNGLTNYESYDSVSGNTYKKTFTLTGNVFSPKQLAVYIRDGAGNIRTTYVSVDALDNTLPTISNAVATVNGASATISITASDVGVGVSNYAITTTNTAPTTGWSTSKNFTVSKSGKYYVWALDYAGNISASKICTVNLNHTVTVNLDGASYYKPDGTYVANGTTWSKQFTYGTPINVIGTSTATGDSVTNIISKPTKVGMSIGSYSISGGSLTESNSRMLFDASYDGDVTININWTPNKYKITLEGNNGSFRSPDGSQSLTTWSKDFTYNQSTYFAHMLTSMGDTNLNAVAEPTRVGHKFAGWKLTSGGGSIAKDSNGYWNFDGKYAGNVVVTAQWTPNKYTLTINPNGGSMYNGDTYTSNTFTTEFTYNRKTYIGNIKSDGNYYLYNAPSKSGYTFTGFNFSGGTGGKNTSGSTYYFSNNATGSSTEVYIFNGDYAGNVTATAQYTANIYKITLDTNGGTLAQSGTSAGSGNVIYEKYNTDWGYSYNSTALSPTINWYGSDRASVGKTATRTGYKFKGFYTSTSGGTQIINSSGTMVVGPTYFTSDTTLYAQWSPKQYTLTINPNGGSMYGNINGTLGWFNNSQTRLFTYNTPLKFASTAGYANSTNGQFYLANVLDGNLYKPLRTGYTFNGWKISSSRDLATVSYVDNGDGTKKEEYTYPSTYVGNDTVTAQWDINKSTLTVYPNGGSWSSYGYVYSKSFTQNYNTTLAIPDPVKPNYTATFNANGGTCTLSSAKTNVAFSSWNTNSIGTAGTLSNKVFTFGPTKDGSGSIQALWNGSYDVTLPTPSRVGYTFNGWYTAATGGTKVGNAGTKITLSSDITYYAQWTPNKYDLTVNPNGGWMYTPLGALTKSSYTKKFTFDNYICYISTGTVEFYNADYLAVSLPERPGYTFRGWKITSGGGSVGQRLFQEWWDYDASYAGNVTVTAQWEPNLYNLTINPNGGEFIFVPINTSGSNTYNYRQTASYTRKFVFGKETIFSSLRNDTVYYYSESLSDIYNKSISGGTSRPIRRGYTLNSWSSPVNSSGVHSTTNSYGEVIQNGVKSNSSAFSYTGDYAGDITISANWLANKYSIKYLKGATDCSDSLTPSAQSATYDTNVTLQKSGSLKGRSYEITLDSNIPSTASTASTYNITSNKISGNLVFSSWETQKENNTELSWGTDSYGGYAYMNYGYDLKNYSSGQTVTKANFTSVPNGQVTATARYNSTTITPYTPSMTGYLFKGWYADKACTAGNEVTSLKIDESTSKYSKTLYAKWEPIKYKVVYHGNSHWNLSQGDYTQELTFDATERLTTCKFTRIAKNPGYTHRFGELEEGYDFIGWTKTKNSTTVLTQTAIGTGKSITYVDGAVGIFNLTATNGATIDLYTIWRKDLSLAFNLNGGLYNGKDTINTLEVYIWNNSYEYNFNINDYYGTVTNNGLNSKLGKVDEAGNIYRFLGWSLNKNAVVPDSNLIVYDSNRVNGYVIQDDKTLYAVWEKILIVNYDVGRTKGEQEPESEALPGVFPSIKNITAITSNPSASVIIKPGEEGYYKLDIAGTPTSANAVFTETVTNMYTEITPDKWKDQFNQPDSESKAYDADLGITKSTSGLNKKLVPSRLIKRTFHVPVYFADAYSSNYFTLQHTIQQESYYYKNWVSGKDKEEIKIKTLVYIDSSPGDGDRPSTLDELKSLIKTKIVQ